MYVSDAPRAWYEEASRRLTSLGFVKIPLDVCPDLRQSVLCGQFGGDSDPAIRTKITEDLQQLFDEFEFLGVQMADSLMATSPAATTTTSTSPPTSGTCGSSGSYGQLRRLYTCGSLPPCWLEKFPRQRCHGASSNLLKSHRKQCETTTALVALQLPGPVCVCVRVCKRRNIIIW
ncbi:GIP [Symbiodinium natans]|uniref:GIP protein n=1 Tax=Symbiodinium natans TaxID=878477 RepID=A0A812M4I1_9DINO|nr:GIP [Symbiodinium natans]